MVEDLASTIFVLETRLPPIKLFRFCTKEEQLKREEEEASFGLCTECRKVLRG
jgi:hypothetical protein